MVVSGFGPLVLALLPGIRETDINTESLYVHSSWSTWGHKSKEASGLKGFINSGLVVMLTGLASRCLRLCFLTGLASRCLRLCF